MTFDFRFRIISNLPKVEKIGNFRKSPLSRVGLLCVTWLSRILSSEYSIGNIWKTSKAAPCERMDILQIRFLYWIDELRITSPSDPPLSAHFSSTVLKLHRVSRRSLCAFSWQGKFYGKECQRNTTASYLFKFLFPQRKMSHYMEEWRRTHPRRCFKRLVERRRLRQTRWPTRIDWKNCLTLG